MPMFSYVCAGGHSVDLLRKADERDHPVACPACGVPARRMLSLTAPIVVAGRSGPREGAHVSARAFDGAVVEETDTLRIRIKGATHDLRCPDIRCDACEHLWYAVLEAGEATPACPKCRTLGRELPGVPGGEWSQRMFGAQGGYFDRGLGCWVNSPAHRLEICKTRGLTPVDGDWDVDRALAEEERQNAADDAEYDAYQDKLNHHPAYAGYRRARDNGWLEE